MAQTYGILFLITFITGIVTLLTIFLMILLVFPAAFLNDLVTPLIDGLLILQHLRNNLLCISCNCLVIVSES